MKNKKDCRIAVISVCCIIVIIMIVSICLTGREKKEEVTVGFVMPGSIEEQGWNSLHYQGIKIACEELNAKLLVKENIPENSGLCLKAIHELADEGADMIVLASYGYAKEAEDTVKQYPEIVFYSESFDNRGDNINCYFARAYQARYLSGIVAGMTTKTNSIGYVAAMPNNEVNRGISAFTLGVQRVNPKAQVWVMWTDSWDDKKAEQNAAKCLLEECNADVLTYHQNQTNVALVAEKNNVASIGYHLALEGASERFLTAVLFRWDITYKELIMDYMRGKSDEVDFYWFGIERGAISLAPLSPAVSKEVEAEIEKATNEMLVGADVFSGEILDTNGEVRCEDGEIISDEALMTQMDWFVEGVRFYE